MRRDTEQDLFDQDAVFEGAEPRVFSTNPDSPEDGRTFVWAKTRWFERMEGDSGGTTFSPVYDDESELRQWLSQQGLEMTEIDDQYAAMVQDEFAEQTPLYPEAPELSNQESSI